jgi:hypothetical protein
LVVVPAGCADAPQPRDRDLFGAFKAIDHRLYRCEVGCRCSKAQFAIMLVRAWAALPESAIRHPQGLGAFLGTEMVPGIVWWPMDFAAFQDCVRRTHMTQSHWVWLGTLRLKRGCGNMAMPGGTWPW